MKNNLIRFFAGFKFAFQGIVYTVKTQTNFRFHITATVWVLLISTFYEFTKVEYTVLFLTIGAVLAFELINTAVEKTVDLCTKERNEFAKFAKDAAAGAVLISAITAVCVAICLFADADVITYIADFVISDPVNIAVTAMLATGSVIFIFKGF